MSPCPQARPQLSQDQASSLDRESVVDRTFCEFSPCTVCHTKDDSLQSQAGSASACTEAPSPQGQGLVKSLALLTLPPCPACPPALDILCASTVVHSCGKLLEGLSTHPHSPAWVQAEALVRERTSSVPLRLWRWRSSSVGSRDAGIGKRGSHLNRAS